MSRRTAAAAALFLAALLFLGYGAGRARIGAGFLDPVGRVTAQDEAVYSHIAIQMAASQMTAGGEWLTPVFLGRYFLYKPPLVYWLPALSTRLFGVSATTLRLPSIFSGALIGLFLFLWIRQQAGSARALLGVALALSSTLFHTLAQRNLTDAMLTAAMVAVVYLLHRHSKLDKPSVAILLGCACGIAVLAKSIAGLLPAMIICLYFATAPKQWRPSLPRLLLAVAAGAGVALPWFLYQYWAHPRWFWAEFVQVELLAWGAAAPPQTSAEGQVWFYASRLWVTDPWLCLAAAFSIPGFVWKLRQRGPSSVLLACWIAVTVAAPLLFQYRNATYLMPLIPALAVLAATHFWLPEEPKLLAAVIALALLAGRAGSLWAAPEPNRVMELAARYCELDRGNELIVVSTDDEFHATVLPLDKVRYAIEGTGQPPKGFALDFRQMGIVASVDEFIDWKQHRPRFLLQLHQWGLEREDALASVIALPARGDLARLVEASPQHDFLVPARLAESIGHSSHQRRAGPAGNLLLLGLPHPRTAPRRRGCRM
ncbi:MAG: glycosyltransferase family 39 protein [Acidobacteriia bacterium]|nr:glycosyltransferase family 39 protein [Terriglobia bacterium]